MDPLMQAGRTCLRRRARDFLRSKASVVEAMRRLGCTCEGFHELLVALGKTGASLGSVKRHLAEMRRERAFDEATVIKLMDEYDSEDLAAGLSQQEVTLTPTVNIGEQMAGPGTGTAAASSGQVSQATGSPKLAEPAPWKPTTHLSPPLRSLQQSITRRRRT